MVSYHGRKIEYKIGLNSIDGIQSGIPIDYLQLVQNSLQLTTTNTKFLQAI